MAKNIKTYSEMISFSSWDERFNYLKLDGAVGHDTFGSERFLNQVFYSSKEWASIRNQIIIRDLGCDLGITGFDIFGKILIHHMNPITVSDIVNRSKYLLDPEYLVCVSHDTHNAIHFGTDKSVSNIFVERYPNDMCPWKGGE